MRQLRYGILPVCTLLVLAGCGDVNPPTLPSSRITTTAISPTSISLAWSKATDSRTPPSGLVYRVYMSGPNPAYQSFDSIAKVEAGTLVASLHDAASLTLSSGISAGNSYYFNIVVTDEKGNEALYDPLGEYFHAGQQFYYPLDGNTMDVSGSLNPLVVATGLTSPVLTLDRFQHPVSAYSYSQTTNQCLQSTTNVGITGNSDRTVSFWVRSQNTELVPRVPLAWGNGSANGSNFGFLDNGVGSNWMVWLWGTANVSTGSAATASWEHWVIGYSSVSNLVYSYKNGVVVNNGTAPAVNANTVDSLLYVGCGLQAGVPNFPFKGEIDEIRVFNQLLSSTDVTNLYTVTRP